MRQDLPVDLDRLRVLLREKSHVPVRLCLERRIEAMMSEECPDKRYCNCRGFYDGLFMIQCVSCNEWYHGRCVQVSTHIGSHPCRHTVPRRSPAW